MVAGPLSLGALSLYGVVSQHILLQQIWLPEGSVRAEWFLLLFAVVIVPVLAFAPKYFRAYAVLLLLACTVFAVGPLAPLSVLLFLFSAAVIGKLIVNQTLPALLLGVAVLITIEEALVRTPWNYAWVYALLLLLPALIAPHRALRVLREIAAFFRPTPDPKFGERAAAAALTLILTANWLTVLNPETGADALAMHLAIPDGIAWKHQFSFDLAHNVWAVMPMGGDWCFTLVYLLGGEFAARLLNFAFLLIVTGLLFEAGRRFLNTGPALWTVALFAATPLVQGVTGSLMIENVLAAILFGGAAALWRYEETGHERYSYAAAVLLGVALHVKLGSFAFVVPGLVLLGIQVWRKRHLPGPRPVMLGAQLALIFVTAGAPPYVMAALETGNPIFPYKNSVFHSRALAPGVNIDDLRYRQPLRLGSLYDLTFHTNRYFEGQDGSLGLQYLLLFPVGLLLAFWPRTYVAWSATILALCGSIGILFFQPNARYLYEALPFFQITIACVLAGSQGDPLAVRALIVASCAVCLGVDFYLFPAASQGNKLFYSSPLFTSTGRSHFLEQSEPRRLLIDDLNRNHPGEALLEAPESLVAGFRSPIFRYHWHDQATRQQIDQALTADYILALVRKWKIRQFLVPVNLGEINSPPLQEFAKECIEPGLRIGSYFSGHLNATCAIRPPHSSEGIYEDTDSRVTYTGDWARNQKFVLASGGTLSYSNTAGSKVSFAFEGREVTYVYSAAANRGVAELAIDGQKQDDLDLYSTETKWQSTKKFGTLAPGKHVIEVRVSGKKRADSEGAFVDFDAFTLPH